MAESDDWSGQQRRPDYESRQSQSSISRKPLSPSTLPPTPQHQHHPHRRTVSDNISVNSQSQLSDSAFDFSRQVSSVSTNSRAGWLPIGAGPARPAPDDMEGVDLGSLDSGSRSRPSPLPIQNQRPPAWHHQEAVSTPASAGRPKPTPFQFDDSNSRGGYSPAGSYQSAFSPQARHGRPQHGRTDSHAHLLNTPTASDWTRTPRTPPPYTSHPFLPQPKKWYHWRPAWIMYVFFFFGFACALGHHLFYATLNGRPAADQLAMLRYGTILAFACKAGLVAAAITAFRQRVWNTVRNKLLSVAALDSLFAATEDLAALWNLEIYKKASLAMTLAIFVWLTPLVIILTSNTLGVEMTLSVVTGMCPGVKTLNFAMEEKEEWRKATKMAGFFGVSPSVWNTTAVNTTSPFWYDYWTGASRNIQQVATLGLLSQQVMGAKDAGLEICGPGWNCTYVVNFTAPGYKCTELASGVGSPVKQLGGRTAPFDTGMLLPEGNYSYYTHATEGEYSPAQMKETWPGGIPLTDPPFPKNFGAFRTEPIIWTGYSVRVKNGTQPSTREDAGWNDAFVPKIFACENYETAYTVQFNYTGGQQYTVVKERNYLKPVLDTVFQRGVDANDGTNDNVTAIPESSYVYPYPPEKMPAYRRTAAFHTMSYVLRDFVNGTLNSQNVQSPIENTNALQTKLLDPSSEWFPYPDLQTRMQSLYEDVVFSLFSNPQFLAVVWAAKPNEKTGVLKGDDSTLYPCVRERNENRYKYHVRDLWIVYGLALLFSSIAVALGTAAVLQNEGVLRNTRFSSIVAATRGPALEKVMWRGEEGGDISSDVKKIKVGYGIVHRTSGLGIQPDGTPGGPGGGPDETRHDSRYPERVLWDAGEVRYGFGVEGDVRQMRSEGSLFRGR